jgi:hypothetical protein
MPAERSPKKLFQKLFVQGNPEEVAANVEAIRQDRSLLDFVGEQSKQLNRSLSQADQRRMDQYFTAVRDLEQRLTTAESMAGATCAGLRAWICVEPNVQASRGR